METTIDPISKRWEKHWRLAKEDKSSNADMKEKNVKETAKNTEKKERSWWKWKTCLDNKDL